MALTWVWPPKNGVGYIFRKGVGLYLRVKFFRKHARATHICHRDLGTPLQIFFYEEGQKHYQKT